jgi:hypothetical protein
MSLGKLTDKVLEKTNMRPSVIRLVTFVINKRCNQYDDEGTCKAGMDKCYYAQTNKRNELKCNHYNNRDNNRNKNNPQRPAYI